MLWSASVLLFGMVVAQPTVAQVTPVYTESNGLIVDDKVYEHILATARGLIDKRKVTAASKLVAQLERTHCHAALQKPGRKVSARSYLYEENKDAVLVVATLYRCDKCANDHVTAATGFVIDAAGIGVTSYHVFDGHATKERMDLTHVVMDNRGNVYPIVEVLAAHKDDDLAIFRIGHDAVNFSVVSLADAPQVGEDVFIIGHPHAMFYSFTAGSVSRMYMRAGGEKMTVTADFGQGSSGGPVFNDRGNVVGVVSATLSLYHADGNLQMVSKEVIPVQRLKAMIQ